MTRVLNFISSKCSQPGCRNERIFIYVAASKRKQVRGEGGKKERRVGWRGLAQGRGMKGGVNRRVERKASWMREMKFFLSEDDYFPWLPVSVFFIKATGNKVRDK